MNRKFKYQIMKFSIVRSHYSFKIQSQKCNPLILGSILAIFHIPSSAGAESIMPETYRSLELYNSKQIDINVSGAKYQNGNFYTRAKGISTNIILNKGPVFSYNALFQYLMIFGENFNSYPTPTELPLISALNLLNGDIGYDIFGGEIGISNSFNLYFTRRAHHRSSIYIGYGKSFTVSAAIIEEDRLNFKKPKFGFGIKATSNTSIPFFN